MNLENITIVNFKNLVECQLDFSPNINCFIGNNGMGKTNVLDAIYYLSFVKSCSNVSDQLVLNHAADYMMLRGRYSRCGEPLEVAMAYQKGKRKTLKRDGKEYKRFSQHIGLLPLVMVSPMDWDLIRGSGEERRRLMDQIIAQGNQEYLAHLIRYNKALENRNSLIKQGMRDALLFETVEHQLNESGNPQPHLAAFCIRCDGRILCVEHILYLFGDRALAHADYIDRVRDYRAVGIFFQKSAHALVEHRSKLAGRAGQDNNALAVLFERRAWRRAVVILKHGAADGQHRLLEVVLGHIAAL